MESGQNVKPMTKFLQEYDIIAHYSMGSISEHNDVVERSNHTPKDMVSCMLASQPTSIIKWRGT